MARPYYILPGLLAACAATSISDPREPLLRESTLVRHDGTAITLEELASIRSSAIATADSIARLERELHEPGLEDRTPGVLVENLTSLHPSDTRMARTLWESAEPAGRGHGRERFREYGYFCNQVKPNLYAARATVPSLEAFAEELLRTHSSESPTLTLLAAWRRFAPMISAREGQYLASAWEIELDYFRPVRVSLADSLLGPHLRCSVQRAEDLSFVGPPETWDGYTAPVMLVDLLMPGPTCPVRPALAALAGLAAGTPLALPFTLPQGRAETGDEIDARFLRAALGGLAAGFSEPEYLPAATTRFSVTFAYLVDISEARATLSFRRSGAGWELETFDYEPAAANMIGGTAKLDLLPAVRGLAKADQRE